MNKFMTKQGKTPKIKKEKVFRLQAKRIFLTYPKCNIDLNQILFQLDLKFNCNFNKIINKITSYLIVREKHEDGSWHVHVFIAFLRKIDIKNANYLDVVDSLENVFHGNYQSCKYPEATIGYLLKSKLGPEDYLVSDDLKLRIDQNQCFLSISEAMINLAEEGKIVEAMSLLKKEDPKAYVKSYNSYEKSLKEIRLRELGVTKKFNLNQYNIPKGLIKKIETAIEGNKSIIFYGPSGTGKTNFIKSLCIEYFNLKVLVINNVDSIRKFNPYVHNCIIFDDCNFDNEPRESMIKLLDVADDVTLKARYENILIPEGTSRFVVQNHSLLRYFLDRALDRRCVEIKLNDSLINPPEVN